MDLPVVDLSPYLEMMMMMLGGRSIDGDDGLEMSHMLQMQCDQVSKTLRETGALLVKDPRCSADDNDRFLDMMRSYFHKSHDFKLLQQRPNLHYQVGVTPEGVEVSRSLVDEEMQQKIRMMPKEFQPSTPVGPDPKWRYMWRVGPRPSDTRFKELNSEPVVPEGFPEWKEIMDSWGNKMISAMEVVEGCRRSCLIFITQSCSKTNLNFDGNFILVANNCIKLVEMEVGFLRNEKAMKKADVALSYSAEMGFSLTCPVSQIVIKGPHLLAPTGNDLARYGHEGIVFAGYHYDLNFLTIHGRSRFPGLNIWLRNGQKVEVKVPVGCLLIQTGKELEWLTGGECLAGMHEVVVTDRTIAAIELARQQKCSLWRVSSTLFAHIASDAVLKPLGHFVESPLGGKYRPICAGEFVEQELAVINLKENKEH